MEAVLIFVTGLLTLFCTGKAQAELQEPVGRSRFVSDCKLIERLVRLEIAREDQSRKINLLIESDKSKSERISKLEDNLDKIKNQPKKQTVAVKVRVSKDITLAVSQRLIYDTVITNTGNAYNTESGHFRAPVKGTYLFSVTACSKTSDWGVLDIMHDGVIIGQVKSGEADGYYDCNSEVTVAEMDVGSIVWVQLFRGKSGIQNAVHWNSFTAILVN